MWNGAHVDRGQHRFAKFTACEQRFASPHRLVVTHVLIHRHSVSSLPAKTDRFTGFGEIRPQWLLSKNAANMISATDNVSDHTQLNIRRDRDIDNFDRRIVQQFAIVRIHMRNLMTTGHGLCLV